MRRPLKGYQAKFREPVRGTYRGYEIVSMPAPSSGGLTLLQVLKILEGYGIPALGHNTTQTLHLMSEAMHLAYADRGKYLGDADFPKQLTLRCATGEATWCLTPPPSKMFLVPG